MNYRDSLPKGCPPQDSEEITRVRTVFRLVVGDPPTASDFLSQRVLNQSRDFRDVSECQARGLSVFAKKRDAERTLRLPSMRGRLLCRVRLEAGAGRILQTGSGSHHTWWPSADFNILAHCAVEAS